MTVEAHLQIKHHLDCLYKECSDEGTQLARVYVENLNLPSLTPDNRIRLLHNELQIIQDQTHDPDVEKYFLFVGNKVLIYKIYAARLHFYNRKEDEKLLQAFILFEKNKLLEELYQKEMDESPALTFEGFLLNEVNFVFQDLDERPWNTPNVVFKKIKSWQSKRKSECVALEANELRQRFIEKTKDNDDLKHSIIAEVKQLEYIFNGKAVKNPEQLTKELLKLNAVSVKNMPKELDTFYELFERHRKGEKLHQALNPGFFDKTIKSIHLGILSEPPVCCWSLFAYWKWLTDLAYDKTRINTEISLCFEQLFNEARQEGINKSILSVDKLKYRIIEEEMTRDERLAYLMNEYKGQWKAYKKLLFPDYFNHLADSQELKNCFIDNCLQNVFNEFHKVELIKTIVISETIDFLKRELVLLGYKPDKQAAHELFESYQIIELIGCMAPDPGLINRLFETVQNISGQFKNENIPVYFLMEEIKESFAELYEKAEADMKQLFEDQPDQAVGVFASCQIREINYLQSKSERNGYTLHKYFEVAKKFFNDELNNIQVVQNLKLAKTTSGPKIKKGQPTKKISFEYIKTSGDLTAIFDALNIKIGLLLPPSMVADLIRILTCDDLTQIKEKIYLGCQTNEFKYVIKCLQKYFKNLRASVIGRSGIFISVNGNPVTATCLGSSTITNLNTKHGIDNIFSQKQ